MLKHPNLVSRRITQPLAETSTTSLSPLLLPHQSPKASQLRPKRESTVVRPTTLLRVTKTNLLSDPPSEVDSVIPNQPLRPTRTNTDTTSSVSDSRTLLVNKLRLHLPMKDSSLQLPRVV